MRQPEHTVNLMEICLRPDEKTNQVSVLSRHQRTPVINQWLTYNGSVRGAVRIIQGTRHERNQISIKKSGKESNY